eukprot:TRINITY_DN1599_c0_g1_i1.p1 TRINITY_DN1599_c0_g1~~TRINITY_DN1599_c0_g1_i1.p1  ORF type:complete len:255 (-),score=58.98 TRINITY_DN1599_c0_g1_i1:181-945(-)
MSQNDGVVGGLRGALEAHDKEQSKDKKDPTTASTTTTSTTTIQHNKASLETPSTDFAIRHPLQHQWTLWYDSPRKKTTQDTWGSHLKKIVDFDTVEDFWRLYNNIMPSSQLVSGSNYHLFKYGVEPKWEDPINEKGGKWTVNILPKYRKDKLDNCWLYTMLACVGEAFGDEGEEEVCGCVVSIRKNADRISLWTKNAHKEFEIMAIGRHFKRALELPEGTIVGYSSHADAMTAPPPSRTMDRRSSVASGSQYEV